MRCGVRRLPESMPPHRCRDPAAVSSNSVATGSFGIGFSVFLQSTSLMMRRKRLPRSIRDVATTASFLGGKYQSCRVFSVTHGKRLALDADRAVCDGRADLKHVCLKDSFFAFYEIVGVILHAWKFPLRPSMPAVIIFIRRTIAATLPVTLCAKAVALFHQSLDRKSRKLL